MRPRFILAVIGLTLIVMGMAGCGVTATADEATSLRPIVVEGLAIDIGVGSPIPIEVVVNGT